MKPSSLSRETLLKLDGGELYNAIWDIAFDHIRAQRPLADLPAGVQMVWNIQCLEDHVINGGFVQYICSRQGSNAVETVAALQAIGAVQKAAILQAALSLFESVSRPLDYREPWEGQLPDAKALSDLDCEFYRVQNDTELAGLDSYVHEHPDLFIPDDPREIV